MPQNLYTLLSSLTYKFDGVTSFGFDNNSASSRTHRIWWKNPAQGNKKSKRTFKNTYSDAAVNSNIIKIEDGEHDYKSIERYNRYPMTKKIIKQSLVHNIFQNIDSNIKTTKGEEINFMDWAEHKAKYQPYSFKVSTKQNMYLENMKT